DAAPGPPTGRPQVPGPGERSEGAHSALYAGVDGPQRLRPWRHAHRAVRVDDGPGALPVEPRAREELPAVHGPAGDSTPGCDPGAHGDHVLAFGAATRTGTNRARNRGRDGADG